MGVFELPDNKNIGNLFSKYDLFFPSVLINIDTATPHPYISLLPSPPPSNFALEKRNLSLAILIMLFFGFPILSYPIQPHATSIGYTKAHVKTRQSNPLSCYIQIIKPYMGQTHIHQKADSLSAASLSKFDNMVNSKSIFNTKSVEFSRK